MMSSLIPAGWRSADDLGANSTQAHLRHFAEVDFEMSIFDAVGEIACDRDRADSGRLLDAMERFGRIIGAEQRRRMVTQFLKVKLT